MPVQEPRPYFSRPEHALVRDPPVKAPPLFAIRTDRYKYIYHYGLWDLNAFYDLDTDPLERHNLIRVPAYQTRIDELKKQLFDELEANGGLNIPVRRPLGTQYYERKLQR